MSSPIYLSLAGSKNGDFSHLNDLAASGASARWSSLKGVQLGERILIYCQSPHSAIVATAETGATSKVGKRWPYETTIGSVRMLEKPITRVEIAMRFPGWPWAKTTRGGTRPPENAAEWLWRRSETNDVESDCELVFKVGAIAQLEAEGYKVTSRESENVGYDLEAKKRGSVLHVEVKGVSGSLVQFPPIRSNSSSRTFSRSMKM